MERDDLIVNDSYSAASNHDEAHGKEIRKKIWKVTIILTLITAVEVFMGIMFKRADTAMWETVKWAFIIMTLVKAAYIVLVFMHLGDERRNLKWVILGPYIVFILYLIFIGIAESNYINSLLFG